MDTVHIRDLPSRLYLRLQFGYKSRLAPARLSFLWVSSSHLHNTVYSYTRDCSVVPRSVMKVTESDCTARLVSSNFSLIYICSWRYSNVTPSFISYLNFLKKVVVFCCKFCVPARIPQDIQSTVINQHYGPKSVSKVQHKILTVYWY